ncbi:MAG TPA: carbohydrate ABC transporter substrate-binding protein [Chloroflexi bacterium]|jgi:ABC-type glycerol-3-phosphate transport system substrate-binding protein|nr:carbohydrate ABC transporter substrate-binding protein [Chloroflexota bacterium]
MQANRGLSRRQWLKAMGAGVAGALLSSCAPRVVEKVVKETVMVEKEVAAPAPRGKKQVKLICHDWVRNELPIDQLTADYNQAQTDHEIIYERWVEGWDNKVLSAIRAGNNEYSGMFEMRAFEYALGWSKQGLIQPFDDYINGSTAPGADTLVDDMLPVIRGQCILQGKMYGFPIDFDATGMAYRKDYFEELGVAELPGTWKEIGEVAAEIREKHKDENVYGIGSSASWYIFGGPGAIFYNTCKQVFDDDGIVRYDSEEFVKALELCKSWSDRDIAQAPFGTGWSDAWLSGKWGIAWNQHPLAIWAQNNLGKQVVSNPQPLPLGEDGSGCAVWAISWCCLNKAPHPQEYVDYLVNLFYPGTDMGITMNKAVCATGKLPAYQKAWDEVVEADPDLEWMLKMGEIAAKAVPPPGLTTAAIQQDRQAAWSEKYFAGEVGAKEAMDRCIEEIKAEIAKMRA